MRAPTSSRTPRPSAKAKQDELQAQIAAITKDMNDKIAQAQTDEAKAQIRAEAAARREAAAGNHPSHSHSAAKADAPAAAPVPHIAKKKTINDDPLGGL